MKCYDILSRVPDVQQAINNHQPLFESDVEQGDNEIADSNV